MAGPIVSVGATLRCPHGGQVSIVSSNTRVMLAGQPATTVQDAFSIVGCTFAVGTKPQPCVHVQWLAPAVRTGVNQQPAILSDSAGMCLSAEGIPQGPPSVIATQARVKAT